MHFFPLEKRVLLAVDLTVAPLTVKPQLAWSASGGPAYSVPIVVKNIGTSRFIGYAGGAGGPQLHIDVILTKDLIVGNADDIRSDTASSDKSIPAAGSVDTGDWSVDFSRANAAGKYYVAVEVDPDKQVAEANEKNNITLSATPLITVIDDQWDQAVGTAGNDVITIHQNIKDLFVTINGVTKAYATDPFFVFVNGGAGNDKIVSDQDVDYSLHVTGAGGNDTIIGGLGNDQLSGANGKDAVAGGVGTDYLLGGAQADYLDGGDGDNTLSGGGGNDTLLSSTGNDKLFGGAGNDTFLTRNGAGTYPDTLSGGPGADYAQCDDFDSRTSIEHLLA